MNKKVKTIHELRYFIILWLTQLLSTLGSSLTSFALVIWSYQKTGSALSTALLTVCSYAPYVLMSIFAGALTDKWNKKTTMLISDSFAAVCTVVVLVLLQTSRLELWHLYCLNALNGLMNTVQQPASDVATTLLTPKKHYQKVSGMRSFSGSLITVLTPIIATALLSFTSIKTVIMVDLATFSLAFLSLMFLVKIPKDEKKNDKQEGVLRSAYAGLVYLRDNLGILHLILFLSAINLIASIYNSALPAMLLSRNGGSESALGILNTVTGLSMLMGSVVASIMPAPKSRVRVICNTLLLAMSTENFFLAFGSSLSIWCIGAFLGWISILIMNANMDVIFRSYIPVSMQGRVYSARNTLQFFTIPIGYLLGGVLVDKVFEPFMEIRPSNSMWTTLFGQGKGSGTAILFMIIGFIGVLICLVFRKNTHIWKLEDSTLL